MRWFLATPIVAVVVTSGCMASQPIHEVAPLLEEARQNELAAYAKRREHKLRVAGVVVYAGMAHARSVVATVNDFDYGWGVGGVRATEHYVPSPYVVLVDAMAKGGDAVKCYFWSDDLDSASRVVVGTRITVRGGFYQYYRDDRGRLVMVLSGCEVE